MPRLAISWIVILGMLTALGPLCTDFYLPALPELARQLDTTTTLTQLSLTASLLGLGLGQLFFGPLSDRLGRRPPLLLSLVLFIASSLLCATTNSIEMLIVWRFVQGFAGAGGSVLSRAIARDKYQGSMLTQFFALLMTVNGIAPVLSPVLGGYLSAAFDWRMLFWVMAGIGALLLLSSLWVLNETLPVKSGGQSLRQTTQGVIRNRTFMRYCLIQAFMLAGLFSYIGSSSFVLQNEYGLSSIAFSLLFGVNGMGLVVSALIFSRLARRHRADSLLKSGLALALLMAVLTLLFACWQMPLAALVTLFFCVAFNSGISTIAGAEAMSAVDAKSSGTASALLGMLMFLFGGIATPLSGLGGETMLKMSLAIVVSYAMALLLVIWRGMPETHTRH